MVEPTAAGKSGTTGGTPPDGNAGVALTNSSRSGTIAKAVAWPLVVVVALVLFRSQIGEWLPGVGKVSVGSLSIERSSSLATRATPDVLAALEGLSEESIFRLMSRNLLVTCFGFPVDPVQVQRENAELLRKGLLEEISAPGLASECRTVDKPVIGLRLTSLGQRAREFQLGVLAELGRPASSR